MLRRSAARSTLARSTRSPLWSIGQCALRSAAMRNDVEGPAPFLHVVYELPRAFIDCRGAAQPTSAASREDAEEDVRNTKIVCGHRPRFCLARQLRWRYVDEHLQAFCQRWRAEA